MAESADSVRPQQRELDRLIAVGLAWTGGVKLLGQAVSWAMTIIVIRLLTPVDYGIFGMAMLFIQLAGMAAEFGLGSVLVYLNRLDERHVEQLHGLSILFGLAGLLLGLALAYPFSVFFRTAALLPVVIVLATTFLIDSFKTVPAALLNRDMQFKHLAWLDLLKAVLVPAATMLFAFIGLAYWALVLGNVLSSVVTALLVLAWRPQRFAWPRLRELRSVLRFSTDVVVARLAWWGYTNADFVVAGRVLGAQPLGIYNCAWSIACAPMEKIVSVFARVMPPLFSKVNDQPVLTKRYLLAITEILMMLVAPACIGVALVSHDLIVVVLGRQWEAASVPLQLLCVYALFQAPSTMLPHILNAAGRSRIPMYMSLFMLLVMPVTFIAGASAWGITAIAAAWAIIYPIVSFMMLRYSLAAIGGTMREYLSNLRPTFGAVVGMTIVVKVLLGALQEAPGPVRLAVSVAAAIVTYFGLLALLHGPRVRAIWSAVQVARRTEPIST